MDRLLFRTALTTSLLVAGVLVAGESVAVDGGYTSPYLSQWDDRSTLRLIPFETTLGVLLLMINMIFGTAFYIRTRRRRRSPA